MPVKETLKPLSVQISNLEKLLGMCAPVPSEWLNGSDKSGKKRVKGKSVTCLPCDRYCALVNSWRKAMKWTPGLDRALSVMLASIASTPSVGDQLWIKIIGPAACGKSTLCEALSANTNYVIAKSTLRGFHSGYRSGRNGDHDEEDNSLISLISGKTLVTKDGDTLLQSPNLGQILAEARDLYDSVSRSHYRNRMGRDYTGIRMTWILCGTSSLRQLDSSELGERFLDCVIMEGIDDALEDEILLRVVNKADRNLAYQSNGKMESQYEPELMNAMQLTGGYINYLRENAYEKIPLILMDDDAKTKLMHYGKFVAHMRARPSIRQKETVERELATRLVSQLTRLAKCMAFVLNRKTVDSEVLERVKSVAMDTSRGHTLKIVKCLSKAGVDGLQASPLAKYIGQTDDVTRGFLRFLRQINVVEVYTPEHATNRRIAGRPHWRLTPRMAHLYDLME